jgi:para-aminobenzoate synthetase/4-amino-4-deoxychorismate lyase
MIVDMVRNDLGRIADISTVQVEKLFNIEKYPTLWQMTSKVKAVTRSSLSQIFRAMFPAASITGAPKINAMKIIKELESTPRNIYTGSIGFISPAKQAQFNVAIRTLLFNKTNIKIEYGVGGGIVWDSILDKEIEECNTKAKILKPLTPDFQLLETLLWQPDNGFYLRDFHLERMEKSALYFDFRFDRNLTLEELIKFSGKLNNKFYRIRLLLSADGKINIESSILTKVNTNEVKLVGLANSFVSSGNVFLYHKTTNRIVYENALNELKGLNDVLLYNERNEITESSIANIVFEKDGKLFTPPVKSGLLAGTYRRLLLEKGKIAERIVYKDQLNEFDNIFLMNSVRRQYKVKIITGNHSHGN